MNTNNDKDTKLRPMYFDGIADFEGKYTITYPVVNPMSETVRYRKSSLSIEQFQRVLTMEIRDLIGRIEKLENQTKNQKKWYQFWK